RRRILVPTHLHGRHRSRWPVVNTCWPCGTRRRPALDSPGVPAVIATASDASIMAGGLRTDICRHWHRSDPARTAERDADSWWIQPILHASLWRRRLGRAPLRDVGLLAGAS